MTGAAEAYIWYVSIPLIIGFILDALFGDPLSKLHPVVIIGRLISFLEKRLNKGGGRFSKGILLAVIVSTCSAAAAFCIVWAAIFLCGKAGGCIASSLLCWGMLAARGLKTESTKVQTALEKGSVEDARYAVSMIVGRDTERLDEKGITKAAVETVAENTSDGVTAPLFWAALLGMPGMYFYKAVNTMDSMIGYKNERYMLFGRFAARLDDVLNFIPARFSGWLMVIAAAFLPYANAGEGLRIYRRDRKNSPSPNAGCTEAVTAGALGIRLLGPAWYFGKLYDKKYIGDDDRDPEPQDIARANGLMYLTSVIMLIVCEIPALLILVPTG
ncbi:MAG: adenosylcobinamide-phosphate synthase CbiB [Anaerovoracaceae bacterium]|nr:adenosylcobinamide-phosphate synthase CbiB [Bacillota bacterium]MDY2670904.1 adenosylcobinamide-phosphate synthase CbiB [Anaerovoracaceae bacterium]